MSRRRVLGAALAVAAGLGLSLAVAPARADDEVPLGGWSLSAAAHGVEVLAAGQVDATVPDAASTLDTGGLAYARSSTAWPGSLAGNLGDTVPLLAGSALPAEAAPLLALLNDPVRAEARAPAGPATATFDPLPGVAMRSTARPTASTAATHVQRIESSTAGALSTASTETSTRIDGNVAVSEADSAVGGISLAGGLIQIGAVHSTATARSDGDTGTGTASTTVAGVTIAGIPVGIDQTGLVLGTTTVPLSAPITAALSQVVSQLGLSVVVGPTTVERTGRSVTASSGVVLLSFVGGGQSVGFAFGGASAHAAASRPFDSAPAGGPADAGGFAGGTDLGLPSSVGAVDGLGGLPVSGAAPAVAVPPPSGTVVRAAPIVAFSTANPGWSLVAGLLLVLWLGAVLRRLAIGTFDDPRSCPDGGAP